MENAVSRSTAKFFHGADIEEYTERFTVEKFLSSPEAKGIITPQSRRHFHERTETDPQVSGSWLYVTTVAAWTRSLHELWWKPRTKQIQKEERQAVKEDLAKKALERKEKKAANRARAKLKKDQSIQRMKDSRAKRKEKKEKEAKKKAENNQRESRKTVKERMELKTKIRDILLKQQQEKQKKWDQALRKLKKDRDKKKNEKENRKRKREHEEGELPTNKKTEQENAIRQENRRTEHPSLTHIVKKPPDK